LVGEPSGESVCRADVHQRSIGRNQCPRVELGRQDEFKEQRADRDSFAASRSPEREKLAERKGLGYQTLLKMIVHEGLAREARRG
jgi:hypothetical protein